jgi:predicted secreted protein
MILLAIIIIALFGYLKEMAFVDNNLFSIYVKINDNKWEKLTDVDYDNRAVKASPGDIVQISLLENSTILYEWHMNAANLNGLDMSDKYKVNVHRGFRSLLNANEGENFDRVVFEFKVTKAGNESLSFLYQTKENAGISVFEKREITLIVQK